MTSVRLRRSNDGAGSLRTLGNSPCYDSRNSKSDLISSKVSGNCNPRRILTHECAVGLSTGGFLLKYFPDRFQEVRFPEWFLEKTCYSRGYQVLGFVGEIIPGREDDT